MPNPKSQAVEITCKTICKTTCKFKAKLCVNLASSTTSRVKLPLFHHFTTPTPQTFPQPPTSGTQLTFPLFHQVYYYDNYKLI